MRAPPVPHADRAALDLASDGVFAPEDDICGPPEEAFHQLGEVLMSELLDVALSPPLAGVLHAVAECFIGGFHTAALRVERDADRLRDRLALALRDFDGSEVADVDLQELQARCQAADAAVGAIERIRDAAAEAYGAATGETWSPWRGSVRATPVTAAQLDGQAALKAQRARRAREQDPGDQIVVLRAAPQCAAPEDAHRIFDALNWARSQWPHMSLALTDAPGGERLAKRWAAQKHVPLVLARPDFARHGRAAPFRANDTLLALEPVCVLALSHSLGSPDGDAKAFGPVLNLIEQSARAGVRCVRIARKAASAQASDLQSEHSTA